MIRSCFEGVEMVVFSLEDVRKNALQYFGGDELAADAWVNKYALRNSKGELLENSPDQMHRRLAKEFARIESNYKNSLSEDEIYSLLKDFKFIVPQGSPMSAIGNPYKVQSLSNCFVVENPEDSYGSILRADQEVAQIQKRRGGVGVDISHIRPRGVPVKNAAGTSDGIGIFMERYSNTTEEVAQGGRRGALMQTIHCAHPDIERFITIKLDGSKVRGANVSIRVTDEFMKAVIDDSDFTLRWPVESSIAEAKITKVIRAKDLWKKMIEAVWGLNGDGGEPGILFWDRIIGWTPADIYADEGFKTISTNPCGELPLCAYDSCRLLVLNLLSYVKDPFLPTASFDFKLFNKHSKVAQRLMDDIIDLELEAVDKIISKIQSDPEHEDEKIIELRLWKKIREKCVKGRRTGTGITALGDAVAALGIRYSDKKSIEFVEKVYRELAIACHASSVQLAKERGSFPVWKKDAHIGHPFMGQLLENSSKETNEDFSKYGRRNIALTTTAPAGTVSLITQTTSGIEPVYKLSYSRRRKVSQGEIDTGVIPDETDSAGIRWKRYEVYHPGFKQWMDATGKTNAEESPYFGATANEIDWVASIDLQAAAQKWIEHSISKTCNLPENASIDTLSDVYMHAWKSGCKGLTAFRENSRKGVLSAIEKEKSSKEEQPLKLSESHAPKRPKELPCDIHRVKINGEDWTIIVGLFENRPFEIFGGLSKFVEIPKKKKQGRLIKNPKGNTSTYNVSISIGDDDELLIKDVVSTFDNLLQGTLTRVVSLSLRHGVPVQYICEQLVKDKSVDMQDFSRVLSRVLKGYIQNGTKVTSEKKCPECSSDKLGYQEGCVACTNCGWSKCS